MNDEEHDEIDSDLVTKPLKIDWTFWCNKCLKDLKSNCVQNFCF